MEENCKCCFELDKFGNRTLDNTKNCTCILDDRYIRENVLTFFQFYFLLPHIDPQNPPSIPELLNHLKNYSSLEVINNFTSPPLITIQSSYVFEVAKHVIGDLEPWEYLNIGCRDGRLSREISQKLNTMTRHVDRSDMRIGKRSITQYEEFDFIRDNKTLSFEKDEFNVITCFMHLHTYSNPRNILKEIYRVTKPGGILIICEHDCRNWAQAYVYDTVYYILNEITRDSQNVCQYRKKESWRNIIVRCGFRYREIDSWHPGVGNSFFDVFQKPF